MSTTTVWFNQHFSNTWQTIQNIRRAQSPGEFRILCTHLREDYPGRDVSDAFEVEPRGVSESAYVDYCLEMIRKYEVNVFWPWRRLESIWRAQDRFAAQSARLIFAADLPAFLTLQSKARQYAALRLHPVLLPQYEVVNTLAQFDDAWSRLRANHEILCCKPDVSMFGWGFRILVDDDKKVELPGVDAALAVNPQRIRRELRAKEPFKDLLMMPYLPGPERSVDCLAMHGRLLRCIVRSKSAADGCQQTIEEHEHIANLVRVITMRFRLNAVFNVQFRDAGGTPYLLEINPRMSGGLPFASACGLELPLWALRLALGSAREEDIPHPQTGVEIRTDPRQP